MRSLETTVEKRFSAKESTVLEAWVRAKKAVGGARARTQSFFVGECDRFALCFGFRNFPTERFVVNGLQLRELATWRADSQAIRARQQTMVIFYIQTK